MTNDSKTPEQMASKWYWDNLTEESPVVMLTNPEKHPPCPRKAFVAGYKAGQDDMQTQLAVGEDVVRHLLNAPQWISVEERLPEAGKVILVAMPKGTVTLGGIHKKTQTFDVFLDMAILTAQPTHWMPLPEPPREEK